MGEQSATVIDRLSIESGSGAAVNPATHQSFHEEGKGHIARNIRRERGASESEQLAQQRGRISIEAQ